MHSSAQVPRLRGLPGSSPLLQVEHKSRLPTIAGSPIADPVIRTHATPSSFLRGPKPPAQGWAASDTSAYDVAPDSKQNGDQAVTNATERVPYETLLEMVHHTPVAKSSPASGASRLFKTPQAKAAAESRIKASSQGKALTTPNRRVPHLQQQAASILNHQTSSIISPGPDHAAIPPSPAASVGTRGSHMLSQSVAQLPSKASRGSCQQLSNNHLRRSAPFGQVAFGRAVDQTPNRRQPHPPSSPMRASSSGSHPATPKGHLLSQSTDPSNGWFASGGLTPKGPSAARSSAIPSSPGLRSAIPQSPGALSSKVAALSRSQAELSHSSAKIPCTPDNAGSHRQAGVAATTPSSSSTPTGSHPTPPVKQTAAFRTPSVQPSRIGAGRTPQTRASTSVLSSQKCRSGALSASVATSPVTACSPAANAARLRQQAEANTDARLAKIRTNMAQANRAGAHQAGAVRASTGQMGSAAHPQSPTRPLGHGFGAGGQGPSSGGVGNSSSNSTSGKLRAAATAGILQSAAERASISGPLGATTAASVGCAGATRAVSRVRASMPAGLSTTQQQSKAKAVPVAYPHPELSSNTRLQVRGPAGAYKVLQSPGSRSACASHRGDKATGAVQPNPAESSTPSKEAAAAGRKTQQQQQQTAEPMKARGKGTAAPALSSENSFLAYADVDLVLPPSVEASGFSLR